MVEYSKINCKLTNVQLNKFKKRLNLMNYSNKLLINSNLLF